MAMSPDDLRNKTFSIVKKGYERGEVHRFLGSVADELQAFNAAAASDDEIVVADIVEETAPDEAIDELEAEATDAEDAESDSPAAVEPATFTTSGSLDDFDRMGNEISLMLRQAQESAFKIRSDAEVEARTLVDQVRLDIESDRLAHEQAAAELITRTEERAATLRTEAEEYAEQTRADADSYAAEQREAADRAREEAVAEAEADRTSAEAARKNAETEAEKTLADAQSSADEILRSAESDASARAEEIVGEAEATLATMTDAQRDSRTNLEQAREIIDSALEQLANQDD